jgi:hypothetical protein
MVIITLMTYWIEEERRTLFPLRPAIAKTYCDIC